MKDEALQAYDRAMKKANEFENRVIIDMIMDGGERVEQLPLSPLHFRYVSNFWYAGVPSIDDTDRILVFLERGGYVDHHYHENADERITVVYGDVEYKVYRGAEKKQAIKTGILHRGNELFINRGDMHYVFTTKEYTAMMMVEYLK